MAVGLVLRLATRMAGGCVPAAWASTFCLGCDVPATGDVYCSERCRVMDSKSLSKPSSIIQPWSNAFTVETRQSQYAIRKRLHHNRLEGVRISVAERLCDRYPKSSLGTYVGHSHEGTILVTDHLSQAEQPAMRNEVQLQKSRAALWNIYPHSSVSSKSRMDQELLRSPSSGGIGWDSWRPRRVSESTQLGDSVIRPVSHLGDDTILYTTEDDELPYVW